VAWPAIHPFLMSLLQGTAARTDLPSPTDEQTWSHIIGQAEEQHLTGLLSRWLQKANVPSLLPQPQHDELRRCRFQLSARNLLLSKELASILQACAQSRTPCIPIRGLALAEQLYGDITARPMSDIDLLVPRQALTEVRTILKGLGYREMEHRTGFSETYNYTLEFLKDRHGPIVVEPHWTLTYPPFVDRIDMDAVWARSVRGLVGGVETALLCRADLLLHLCCHVTHWRERAPLLWFYELDQVARQVDRAGDWPLVVSIARQSRQTPFVGQIMEELRRRFLTPIPDQVVARLARSVPIEPRRSPSGWIAERAERLLASNCRLRGREEFALFAALPGWRAKLRYAAPLLFPSPAFMRFRYGSGGWNNLPFRYLTRSLRLGWEGLRWLAWLLLVSRQPRHE